uniref:Uncharacterized protein n=1 Tax=Romanomermis culicivorax TaxID=13658 RepID=A0A915I266_ROMCU
MNDLKDLKYYLNWDSSSSGIKGREILEDIDDTILNHQKLIRIAQCSWVTFNLSHEYYECRILGFFTLQTTPTLSKGPHAPNTDSVKGGCQLNWDQICIYKHLKKN